ncbi:uncharacterized protein LOC115888996 [Sitophilus oryzae]|uniref:Uncharacterized protein LOC115888996 n=1 Tax=Sitophilus oryzae TaxID=7048 RepID=A0A6J2YL89_SITOR|nr:uncharacterized protein LOC115888996 [Sitophilus oryzae]
MTGMEGEILNEFFKKHNVTKKFWLVQKDYWGDVFDNGTVYGLRGDVYRDNVDIGVAAHYSTDRMYRFFGLSIPTLRVGLTCLVPAPKLVAAWLTPVYVYSICTWQAIFFGYVAIILCTHYINILITKYRLKYASLMGNRLLIRKFGRDLLGVIQIFFTDNIKVPVPSRNSAAIIMMTMYFFAFFLTRIYESGLATIMTLPWYENSIETREDFLNSNINWGAIQVADWINYWKLDNETLLQNAYNRYIATSSETPLKEYLKTNNFGLMIERLPQHKYHFPFSLNNEIKNLQLMKEDLHREYSVFLLRKSSVLLPSLNDFIYRINEAGSRCT